MHVLVAENGVYMFLKISSHVLFKVSDLFYPLGYWRPLGIPRKHLPPKQGRKDCKCSVPFHWSLDYTFHHLAFNCWHKHSTNDLTHQPFTAQTQNQFHSDNKHNFYFCLSLYISHVNLY